MHISISRYWYYWYILINYCLTAETAGILRINFQATTFGAFHNHGNVLKLMVDCLIGPYHQNIENWFGIEVFPTQGCMLPLACKELIALWWQVSFLSWLELDANHPLMQQNCSGLYSYKQRRQSPWPEFCRGGSKTGPRRPQKSSLSYNFIYMMALFIELIITEMPTKIQDAILYQTQ